LLGEFRTCLARAAGVALMKRRLNATAASLAFGRRDHRRPSFLSLAFARFRPASTRARITTRSNSAKTPIIWNIALPS
jgi:hypothetical protein